ncbi:hypothetical protein COU18_02240 [Candidatus Kaiserbacteria bacterium CG10_big_fil_rev_8_21_14_0_10_51_14]|uniref:Nudix hydrolase domain-containing protein n=1 Tax=Candidatus Kaiserbacteria bacterium CG10_big_fil_rev_8_21_14_0_10_51_14 TaxID=1974610 RepID=A0A2H0UDX3_9BACT|nr:MAG: hypothetical protein COU18_02240 [Candidatus Kaiserbacteria bacterium CG10_big_fil_rev_8_21_14_0_10_51_14]
MRTIHRDIAAAVLISKDGKILLARQKPGGRGVFAGKWVIVGGGIEEGEDPRAALDREFMEEIGVDISPYEAELVEESAGEGEKSLRGTGERVFCKMRFLNYRVVIHDKHAAEVEVTIDNDELSEYRWFEPPELKNITLPDPSVPFFTKLGYWK